MEYASAVLRLKKGRDKPARNRHPWIFSGAVANIEGRPQPGDLVDVTAADGQWLGRAYFNPHSQIRARILSWQEDESIDEDFWRRRLALAAAGRQRLVDDPETDAYRLVFAESDGLPGLIVDRYGPYLVMQCLTMGIDRRKASLTRILADMFALNGIVERSDVAVRRKEGLTETAATILGEQPPDSVTVREHGHRFQVNLLGGQKTGFYLDQRDNRAALQRAGIFKDARVLNAFSYTGAFAVYAAAAGAATITNVDDSVDVLLSAEQNLALNQFERPDDEYIAGDAFQVLRHYRDTGRQFDVVILDPPKFAQSKRDVPAACRGYKDLNWLAMRILAPGGLLATFSCSGLVSQELFQKVLFGAAVDAGGDAQIIRPLVQAEDHPVLLTFPESAYLKGFLCRVS